MESTGRGSAVYGLVCRVLAIVLGKASVTDQVVGSARSTAGDDGHEPSSAA